jgi:hypothetical protein
MRISFNQIKKKREANILMEKLKLIELNMRLNKTQFH